MNTVHPSTERGHANHGWLDSYHSFSFADYFDPTRIEFGPLRVINEDRVAPGAGFGTHAHRDMEIISYVLSGELEHRDSIGNGSVIRPGDVQRMSAGSGIRHSEFNPSPTEGLHFLQIWIKPNVAGIEPSYEEKRFSDGERQGRLRLIASPDASEGSVLIHQDAFLYAGRFDGDERAELPLKHGRRSYVHVVRGSVHVNGLALGGGDALEITDSTKVAIDGGRASEVLVFDLP
jgi:redox-sensitive bicupin YhaK (pirin superfamily)